jgi:hypothetical protein
MTAMRFGVVGTGYWARQTHAAALAAHPDADLVGVWGRSYDRAADLANRRRACLRTRRGHVRRCRCRGLRGSPDVQAKLAVRAATPGLMDKPVAFTSQDAERVVEAVDRAGVRSLVFLTSRFELRLRPHVRLDLRAGRQLGWQPIIVIVPTLIIFLLLQRFIYNGLSAAATK